jgi:two-component system response regulator HydG
MPAKVRDYRPDEVHAIGDDPTDLPTLSIVMERYVRKVLRSVNDNKTLAARILGLDRRTLYRKLRRFS